MNALGLVWWAVAGIGLTNVLVYGAIMEPVREVIVRRSRFLGQMVVCPMCASVWVGAWGSLLVPSPAWSLLGDGSPPPPGVVGHLGWFGLRAFYALLDGCALSGLVWSWVALRGHWAKSPIVVQQSPVQERDLAAPPWMDAPFDGGPDTVATLPDDVRAAGTLDASFTDDVEPPSTVLPEPSEDDMRTAELAARMAAGKGPDCGVCGSPALSPAETSRLLATLHDGQPPA